MGAAAVDGWAFMCDLRWYCRRALHTMGQQIVSSQETRDARILNALLLERLIKDLDNLLDTLVGRQLVRANRDTDRVVEEGGRKSSDRFRPRSRDCENGQPQPRSQR